MDAQNATDADQSKSAGATRRRASDVDNKHPSKNTDRQLTASPDAKSSKLKAVPSLTKANDGADADADEHDSDAETIVLPGKDGHSPSKIRKMRQDDNSNNNDAEGSKPAKPSLGNGLSRHELDSKATEGIKRRRLSASGSRDKSQLARSKDGSSGLSSAPASPPRDGRGLHRRRRSNASPHRSSDSEATGHRAPSGRTTHERLKSGDRFPPIKRKAPKTDSDDEDDHHRKARRQRTTSISIEASRSQKERLSESRNRSHSPPVRMHRRSASTQLAQSSSGGLSQKKRRLPPPLQSTEQHSDDSDRSGSPLPRSSKLRSLATPATADSNVSPAKIMPHKKHLDAHGQTFLARACARGEYDAVKKRLAERPEDINVADYAGNTPLQIAAINGCEDIVELLIEAGCNMDCVNYDKDTPLLDAVDNGHLGVVKLLLDAGVNPRKANVSGQEPIDRITDETENAEDIRNLLMDARKRAGERRRTSEDRHSHPDSHDARDSHAPDSPRHSPAMIPSGSTGRRSGTVRATKTRNDLLYMPLDDKTLRQAAGRGDEETVARILQVKEGYNDPESMVAAARGGHDLVIQLLLGLGSANPDPGPVPSLQPEFATPILAAIGQENIKVVELLLEQGGFDPTRRFKGETYYEIARKRQGTNWKEEENLLKNAYDEYKRTHKDGAKPGKSPGRRERERDREEKRARREEANRDETRSHKRNLSSPSREGERKKSAPHKITSPKERRRLEPGRHAKEERTSSTHTSDRETSPAVSHKTTISKNRDMDAAVSSDGEALKPRRKLVSKGELRGERDKHRRSSMASNASSLKEPSSPQDSRTDDQAPEKPKMSERYHDRTKALKREESKDPSSIGNDGQTKRHRSSVTPDGHSQGDKEDASVPQKRRRLDGDTQDKRSKPPLSPETRHAKLNASRDGSKSSNKANRKSIEDDSSKDAKDDHAKRDQSRKESVRSAANEPPVRVKSEDDDVHMHDVESAENSAREQSDKKQKKDTVEHESAKREEERQRMEAKKEEEERKRVEKEEERKRLEAEEKKRLEEVAAKEREAAEKAKLEFEAQQRLEEEKRRKKEEEERHRKEEQQKREEEERKKQEDLRKKQEEEEKARREQLEREAAEVARRKREEDQRKEKERRERAQREELERKRLAREAEQRRAREEQKARLDKLPPLLRWLDLHPNPKTKAVAERFSQVQGCRYDTIDSSTNGTAAGREEWVLNTAVALLLGEKDLTLSRYSAWEHIPVSNLAKETIWRTEWMQYSLASQQYFDLGREVPGLYPKEPTELTAAEKEDLKKKAWQCFCDLPMFFVKVSELLYTVPHIPHLRDVRIGVGYRELQEPEGSSPGFKVVSKPFRYLAKHLSDPQMERYHGRAPRWRWYLNGAFVEEDLPKRAITSKMPFNERPVPRRGLLAVTPDDPDYLKICREQGITPLIKIQSSPTLTNGVRENIGNVNGIYGNGGAIPSPEDAAKSSHTLNGINGTS